jgi:putative nucleotidyltransferase-like protein
VAVLLACARAASSSVDDRRLAALIEADVDFAALLALAERHRMTAFVHAHLSRIAPDRIPHWVMSTLHQSSLMTAARGLMLGAELVELIRLFAAHGIRALPFKGPVLAECLYGNLALRFMRDIDILVAPTDVHRAQALLLDRGYQTETKLLPGSIALRLEYQLCVSRPADTAIVELHWTATSLSVAPEVGIEDLWDQRLHTCVLGERVPCPSHEHLLILLCMHGARHAWWRLELICGVAELVRSKPVDWYRVLEVAAEWRCGRMLRVGLLLAREVLGAAIPQFALDIALGDPEACTLARQAHEDLFAAEPSIDRSREPRRFQLRIQEDSGEKLRALWYRAIGGSARKAAVLSASVQEAYAR